MGRETPGGFSQVDHASWDLGQPAGCAKSIRGLNFELIIIGLGGAWPQCTLGTTQVAARTERALTQ